MKKIPIILIGLVSFMTINCRAQVTPLEEMVNYIFDDNLTPDEGTYFKDVNHLLDKYVGEWEGTYAGKTFRIIVIETLLDEPEIKIDELEARYTITDNNTNSIIVDTTGLPTDSPYVLSGEFLNTGGRAYSLFYIGFEVRCGQEGIIILSINENEPNEMKLKLEASGDIIIQNECPNGFAHQIFPTGEWMTLTKQ